MAGKSSNELLTNKVSIMKQKVSMKSRLDQKDIERIQLIRNDLFALHPVWSLMCDLFGGFDPREYQVLVQDIQFLLQFINAHPEGVNIPYLLSLSKSASLLADRFSTEMLEAFHPVYEHLDDASTQFKSMFEAYSEALSVNSGG